MAHYGSFTDLSCLDSDKLERQRQDTGHEAQDELCEFEFESQTQHQRHDHDQADHTFHTAAGRLHRTRSLRSQLLKQNFLAKYRGLHSNRSAQQLVQRDLCTTRMQA